MNELNKKYVLQMEVLTPLHVGAGAEKDWVHGADFVVHDNKVKVLNLKKVANFVNTNDLSSALINKNGASLVSKLGANIDDCVDKVFESNFVGSNDIKTFIKNGLTNLPLMPGSSLKGAIRSVLLEALHTASEIKNAKDIKTGKWTEQALFGSANKGDEYFRFIKVSDAHFERTNIINSKIFNLKSQAGGWKHGQSETNSKFNFDGFNTFYEVILPGEKSLLTISFANIAFENYGLDKFSTNKQNLLQDDFSYFCNIINAHTKKHLLKEKAFFQKYTADKSEQILTSIDKLLTQIPENGEYCILKMAAGSGFHSITGDWQFEDYTINGLDTSKRVSRGLHNNEKSAKSRKIAILPNDEFHLMGFVKIKALTEQELVDIELEKQRQKAEAEAQIKEQRAIQQELQRIALENELERQRKNELYHHLISEAEILFENAKVIEAKLKIDEAIGYSSNQSLHNELYSKIIRVIEIIEQEMAANMANNALEQARIASNKIPLWDKIAEKDNFKNVFGNVKAWMRDNEVQSLDDADFNVLVEKLASLYSLMRPNDKKQWSDFRKWSDLAKVIGEDAAQKVFNQIIV